MTALATVAEVTAVTGVTVTVTELIIAHGIIALTTGLDMDETTTVEDLTDTTGLRDRDVRLVRSAIRWQAAYLHNNPSVLTTAGNLVSAGANGVTAQWDATGSAGALVGPLAKLALGRLSWKRSRGIRLKRVPDRPRQLQTLTDDGSDGDWTPEGRYAR